MTRTMTRWKTCVHEGGHMTAAAVLLGDTASAAVVLASGGLAYIDTPDPLRTFPQALAVAVGPAAESLADVHPAPEAEPTPAPLVRADAPPEQSAHAALTAELRAGQPDAARLARWCCECCPHEPQRWARRHAWIQREARRFVQDHAQEIVTVATRLYARGVFYPTPARTGTTGELKT